MKGRSGDIESGWAGAGAGGEADGYLFVQEVGGGEERGARGGGGGEVGVGGAGVRVLAEGGVDGDFA